MFVVISGLFGAVGEGGSPGDISVIEKGNTNNRKIYVGMTVLCVSTAFNLWEVITFQSFDLDLLSLRVAMALLPVLCIDRPIHM